MIARKNANALAVAVSTWQLPGLVRSGRGKRRSSLLNTERVFLFKDARKVVNSRFILTNSYAMAAKGKQVEDAQTQTDVAVQTESSTITPKLNSNKSSSKPVRSSISSSKSAVRGNVNQKPEKPTRNKSPSKSEKVLSDRLPKGSDDPIQQHNRFHCLDEDMEAESSPTESINKQGRIIKINNKK